MATESFFSSASLAYLASAGAGKDGKAYSIKPTDGTGDFTFSRGSNLAATRVGPTGLIEKGRENLLLQSNNFSQWSTNASALTSGQTGYDGSSDAWLLTKSGANGFVYRSVSGSGIQTVSVYAKQGTNSWMQIYVVGTSNVRTYFDLGNGTLGAYAFNVIDRSIEDVGNGWYRCSVVFNNSTSQVRFFVSDGNNDDTGTSGSIYIQDSQLEIGLAATDYIESGATTGKAGLLEDEPRFDYSGGVTCPSLLLEPSRTNLIDYSEYLPGLSIIGSPVFTANATTSPEGYQNMAEFSSSATSDRYQENLGVLTGQHVFSAFFKYAGTEKSVYIRMSDTSSRLKIDIASSGVTIDAPGSSNIDDSDVINYGNGIYRVYMIFTPSTGTTFAQFYPSATDTTGSVYAYGFQVEQGSYPTSYIPNHSGGTITRGADSNVASGLSSVIGQTEGTLFIELDIENLTGDYRRIIGVSDGTVANFIGLNLSSDGKLEAYVRESAIYSVTYFGPTLSTGVQKLAITYKTNEARVYRNGTLLTTDTSVVVPACSNLYLGKNLDASTTSIIGNKVKQALLFDTALSGADCITLTTL